MTRHLSFISCENYLKIYFIVTLAKEILTTPGSVFQAFSGWRAKPGVTRITGKLTDCVVILCYCARAALPDAIERNW